MNRGKPVLIYSSLTTCSACMHFKPEWEKIKRELESRVIIVEFVNVTPKYLEKYTQAFPSIVIVNQDEYYRYYNWNNTPKNINAIGYTIPGFKFNEVYDVDTGKYIRSNKPRTVENAIEFVYLTSDLVVNNIYREKGSKKFFV